MFREALHNHVIIVLLVISLVSQLTGVCFYIVYSKIDQVWLASPFFCNLWQFVDIGLFDMIGMLLAYAAIKRHVLIFHYIPLSLTIIYGLSVYIILIFFAPCENLYDYTQPLCGSPCYFSVYDLVIYDVTVNCIFPVVLMIFFNLTLIIRHIRQKQRVTQQIQWHKHRKMIFQLLSITLLLLIFYLPICILMMINSIIFIFLCLFSCSPNAFCLFAVDIKSLEQISMFCPAKNQITATVILMGTVTIRR